MFPKELFRKAWLESVVGYKGNSTAIFHGTPKQWFLETERKVSCREKSLEKSSYLQGELARPPLIRELVQRLINLISPCPQGLLRWH